MIQLIDKKSAEKIVHDETRPSCTMYVYFYHDDKANRDTPRYVAIDARDGKELWVEDFARLDTAMRWLLDVELEAEELRKGEV